jgi:L-seryl-tRNA(Ser) seleniumtransferase/D-glucosaminate-6-phosphate ammonia-lyase
LSIYKALGIKTYINAWGKATALGASLLSDDVLEAMKEASKAYVDMEELHRKAGEAIAKYTGAEYACVTCGAASGLCAAVAACMTGKDESKIMRIPDTEGMPNKVVVQKAHAIYYTMLVRLTGAKIVVVGSDEWCTPRVFEEAMGRETCAVLYQASIVRRGVIPLEDLLTVAHRHGIPVIVDAAAMTDHRKYIRMGVDLVVYSGGKAFGGPTASGFVCGRRDLVEACHLQRLNICRPQKVGKEEIVGLLKALEIYVRRDAKAQEVEDLRKARYIAESVKSARGVNVELVNDDARPEIWRVKVSVDEKTVGLSCSEIRKRLAEGEPGIILRPSSGSILLLDVRQMRVGDEVIVARRLLETLEGL